MHLTLHITSRCNLACAYCYARQCHLCQAPSDQPDMTLATAIQAISCCATAPNTGIIFFGGEPLLRQDLIWSIMDWCEQTHPGRFHYKVTTNGTLLDEDFLDAAVRRSLHIAMSHDGVREAHDRFRMRPDGRGTFDELLPRLQRLLARRPYSPILLTVNPETVDRYAESVRWLQAAGVQYLIGSLNHAAVWTPAALRQLRRAYEELAEWHAANYREERKFYFSPFDRRIATRIFDRCDNSCQLGVRQISVATDGRLYPCVQFVGRDEYAIGSAAGGLDLARRQEIHERNERDKPACAGCALVRRCHNKCGCLNLQATGSLDEVPTLLCEHERMVFPIADRLAERLYAARTPMFLQRHYNPAFPVLSFLEDLAAP